MNTKKDGFQLIVNQLSELHKEHPTYSFGKIISMAFADYTDVWGITDKEALFALEKFKTELDLDLTDQIASPEYMEKLYKDVDNFDDILNEDEDETD